MHRRALLVALGSLGAGCLGAHPSAAPTATGSSATEYHLTDLSVSTTTDRPSVKYVLKPTAFYSADAVERERGESEEEIVVMDVSEIKDPAVRNAVTTALREDEWRSNTLPEGLADLIDEVDFFTGVSESSTHTHVGLELYRLHPDRPPAIEFTASVVDEWVASDDPGALEFTLTNSGKETQEIFSGTVPPFGIVRAARSGGEFILWRNYEEEGCVNFTDDGLVVCAIGIMTELKPGEEISREYEVLPSTTTRHPDYTVPPGPGRYLVTDEIGYSAGEGAPGSTLSFEVEFDLRSTEEGEAVGAIRGVT